MTSKTGGKPAAKKSVAAGKPAGDPRPVSFRYNREQFQALWAATSLAVGNDGRSFDNLLIEWCPLGVRLVGSDGYWLAYASLGYIGAPPGDYPTVTSRVGDPKMVLAWLKLVGGEFVDVTRTDDGVTFRTGGATLIADNAGLSYPWRKLLDTEPAATEFVSFSGWLIAKVAKIPALLGDKYAAIHYQMAGEEGAISFNVEGNGLWVDGWLMPVRIPKDDKANR